MAVRIPMAHPGIVSAGASAARVPFGLGPGELLLRTFRPEPRFLLREFLGGEGIVLTAVLALGTVNAFALSLGGAVPGILPASLLVLTLVTGAYFALEARATYRHQAVWITDQRVVHAYGAFKRRFRPLLPDEVVPGEPQQNRMDRLFNLARLPVRSLWPPAQRPALRERLTSSPEDDFIRGLPPRAAGELRHLLLSLKARRAGPPPRA